MVVTTRGRDRYFEWVDGDLNTYSIKNIILNYSVANSESWLTDKRINQY